MHSINYANQVNARFNMVLTPPEGTVAAYQELIDFIGEDAAEEWLDVNVTDFESYESINQKIADKLAELHNVAVICTTAHSLTKFQDTHPAPYGGW